MPYTLIPKNSSDSFESRYDDRKGLGYGTLDQTFHGEHELNSDFPYLDPDVEGIDDIEISDEAQNSVNKKIHKFQRTDPGAEKAANRLYFAGASTKLHACFENPKSVLKEIMAIAKGMEPRGGSAAVGGYSAWKAFDEKPYKRTGTTRGWSSIPPLSMPAAEEEESDEELYNLQDFADIQSRSLDECFRLYDHT